MNPVAKLPAALILLILAFMPGCGDNDALLDPVRSKDNYVTIVSMQPALSETLVAGTRVDFEIGMKYSLQEATGEIALVIQRAEAGFPSLASEIEILSTGEGRIILRASVAIPDTTAIQVLAQLSPHGENRTPVADSRVYRVKPGPGQEV